MAAVTATAPARSALAEPTTNPPVRWVVFLTIASIGLWAGFFGPIQVLLAQQAEAIDAEHKKEILTFVLGLGAFVSVVCNPVFGAFSDRTTLRAGRRLPWVVAGALGGALSLLLLSVADSVVVMALGWCGVQAALNAMLAAVTATIPDQVPVGTRGRVGGVLAIAQTVGVVGGVGIASATGSIAAGYVVTAAVLVLLTLPYCFDARDLALAPGEHPPPFDWGAFATGFWVSPRTYPDFAWAWLTRFLVNLGNALGLLYLLYYMQDVLGFDQDDAADRVFLLTGIYAAVLMATAVAFGIWSDRSGRRKVFVIWSGLVGSVASLLLAVGQSWPTTVLAAILMGVGYGIYTSVDFAMITQVLPRADDRAKDLGVINIANALPQVFAPFIAALVLIVVEATGGVTETNGDRFSVGYCVLYLSAFLVAVLGSVFVTRIRSVR
ncbi:MULTISPECIES: MFS transporter [unclassified Nocardioides]|uniref:MFS transporter n=1 Tax=unclassified Nocardioides TaxID=2615069 RepID=UPI0009EFA489|nr:MULTISPECIES: MFS transporter [unclassified Nocardioides]GAW50382.1 major facilitator transporter [Nocardioides sp. PD653-B2]GAW53104.1 major facilitator transporter [Nocardioides sp. PD653]